MGWRRPNMQAKRAGLPPPATPQPLHLPECGRCSRRLVDPLPAIHVFLGKARVRQRPLFRLRRVGAVLVPVLWKVDRP